MTKLNALSEKITATLIEAIESRDYTDPGPALPWHRTGTADHLAPSNATTGNYYHTGALDIFQIHECTRFWHRHQSSIAH